MLFHARSFAYVDLVPVAIMLVSCKTGYPHVLKSIGQECRAPKFLVDPLEGPSMRQCGSGWNLGHDPDFQH
jgi:hypothetical protein